MVVYSVLGSCLGRYFHKTRNYCDSMHTPVRINFQTRRNTLRSDHRQHIMCASRCKRNCVVQTNSDSLTLNVAKHSGRRQHLIGGCRRQEGWGQAVALGYWSAGQWAAPGSRPVIGKRSAAQRAWCTLRNKPNICYRHVCVVHVFVLGQHQKHTTVCNHL